MATPLPSFPQLEKFRLSKTVRNILEISEQFETREALGCEAFFRGCVEYGKTTKSTFAIYLNKILAEKLGSAAFETSFPAPVLRPESAPLLELDGELIEAFQFAAFLRQRTGGKDDYLGIRHVLFAICTSAKRTLWMSSKMGIEPEWLASRCAEFIREHLETGENWEEWQRNFAERGVKVETPIPTNRKSPSAPVVLNLHQRKLTEGTQAILQTAAERLPDDRILNTTMVLIELAERGRPRGPAEWSADFLRQEIIPFSEAYIAKRNEYLSLDSGRGREPNDEPRISVELDRALTRAGEIAWLTTEAPTIYTRHLLAALVAEDAEMPGSRPASMLEELGISLPLLREHLFEWVRGYGDDDDEWRLFLLGRGTPAQQLTGFDADDTRGPDLLDVGRDVRALATLIASRSLTPPLSIGLFGDWGTGKTFFMRQLRGKVQQLSQDALASQQPQREVPFYKHIVQIEFNAWHYVEGNLWASLVEHIFRNLKQKDDATRASVEALQQHWIEQLGFKEIATAKAEERVKAAKVEMQAADVTVKKLQQEQSQKTEELQRLSAQSIGRDFQLAGVPRIVADALEPLGLKPVGDAAADLESGLRHARSILERGGSFFTALLHAKDRDARWRSLLLILIGGPAAALLVNLLMKSLRQEWIAQISSLASGAVTLLTTGAVWLRRQSAWASEQLNHVEAAHRKYDEALRKEQAETAKQIAAQKQALAESQIQYAAAQQAAAEARREYEAVKKELAEATPERLLGRFIEDRAASSDYRKHLGVLAVIREDFQALSELIEKENNRLANLTTLEEERRHEDKRVNRIVLYIDDLDRCPPNKVIEVLQAVHLLLAFPLFVVVVGVDARWVARSLKTRYKELLHVDGVDNPKGMEDSIGVARSDDYLEKIFQIPLWLRPLDPRGVRRMMQGLLKTTQPVAPRWKEEAPPPAVETAVTTRASILPAEELSEEKKPQTIQLPSIAPPPGAEESVRNMTLQVESLDVRDFEIAVIDNLSEFLGRSPRALKRFVNVYRLIKAGLTPAELAAFVKPNANAFCSYEAVLLLLAIDTGLPRISQPVFELLRSSLSDEFDFGTMITSLDMTLKTSPEWRKLRAWLDNQQKQSKNANAVAKMVEWAPNVCRYSFQASQDPR